MKFVERRHPFTDPDATACRLVEIANARYSQAFVAAFFHTIADELLHYEVPQAATLAAST